MSPTLLLSLLTTWGPAILPIVQKLFDDFAANRTQTTVTADDITELTRLSSLTAADIYKELGIQTPPAS